MTNSEPQRVASSTEPQKLAGYIAYQFRKDPNQILTFRSIAPKPAHIVVKAVCGASHYLQQQLAFRLTVEDVDVEGETKTATVFHLALASEQLLANIDNSEPLSRITKETQPFSLSRWMVANLSFGGKTSLVLSCIGAGNVSIALGAVHQASATGRFNLWVIPSMTTVTARGRLMTSTIIRVVSLAKPATP